jgi:hypothetical protein
MNDNFNDRLLAASLKEYSRVAPPDDFAPRVLSQRAAPRPMWLAWLAVPAAAAALACGVVIMHPVPPAPPLVGRASLPAAFPQKNKSTRQGRRRPHFQPPFHTLTAVEMASMTLPAELFAKHEEQPITEIVIPELTVAPLEIPTLPEAEGEKP